MKLTSSSLIFSLGGLRVGGEGEGENSQEQPEDVC